MISQSHVFISYSRRNTDIMIRIREALTRANIPVWTDEQLTPGTASWKDTIERAIQAAYCVVVLMSPPAKASEWIERELDYAYILQRPIYPVLVDGTQRDAVPFEIINIQYVDLRIDFDHGMQQLIPSIQAYLNQFSPLPDSNTDAVKEFVAKTKATAFQQISAVIQNKVTQFTARVPRSFDPFPMDLEPEKDRESEKINLDRLMGLLRIIRWYFIEPRKYHLFIVINKYYILNYVESVIIILISVFVLLPYFSTNQLTNIVSTGILICFFIFIVNMRARYQGTLNFFSSILSASLLLLLLTLITAIPWLLALFISVSLKGSSQ